MRLRIGSAFSGRRLAGITTIALLGAVGAGLGTSLTVLAAQQVITSAGPLNSIYISDTLNCQVAHNGDSFFEFYPPNNQTGDCGTFVVISGTLYGFTPFSGSAAGSAQLRTPFTPVSQSGVLGSGTSADPFRVVTVVDAGTSGIQLTETDSYVVGQEVYRTDVKLANSGNSALPVLVYRAGDCYLQSSDYGFGRVGPGGAIACTVDQTSTSRIEQWVPITGGSRYYETFYDTGWAWIGSQAPFPNSCDCTTNEDNWAGLSWGVTIAAASSTTISHLTVFSPLGTTPLATTKTADSATAPAGTADGYTITLTNSNVFAVPVSSIFDDLPAGFSYTLGSTSGITTSDPVVTGIIATGLHLTWSGPFSVPNNSNVTLHFGVTVSSIAGVYFNNAGADAGNVAVVPTGPTAQVTVTTSEQPITAAGVSISATEGQQFSGTVATFTDPDLAAMATDYSATIVWGDGNSSPGTIAGGGGTFTVSGVHTYLEEGTYNVTVTITDVDTGITTATANSATVLDAALTATPACPATSMIKSFSGTTATFTDAASPSGTLSDFSATINWGDTSSSTGTITGPIAGVYTVTGTHTYATTGTFTIKTTITDVGGSTATTSCSTLGFTFAPGGGSFVIGDKNAVVGKSVTFWGAQWAKTNSLSGGSAPSSFKGFAENPTAPSCLAGWSADTGNSTPPPAGPLPTFMAVIVTSSADQSGSTISGNNVEIVIVQTNPGYAPDPGHAGTGTVVAVVVC
ncbi:MAG TPA: hypothetical protein VIJ91_01405 [Candidatus Dormibacteraeota bacterium]